MAIPPSPGKFTVDELQNELDKAKAHVTSVEGQLAELKKNPDRIYEHKPAAGRGGKFPDPIPASTAAKSDFDKSVRPSPIPAASSKK